MLILALVCVESSIRFTLASITPAFRAISMVVEINTLIDLHPLVAYGEI